MRLMIMTRRQPVARTAALAATAAVAPAVRKVKGVEPHASYGGVAMRRRPGFTAAAAVSEACQVSVAEFSDRDAVERLKRDRRGEVVGVFADPRIHAAPAYCANGPAGTHKDVARKLGVPALKKAGLTGKGVKIAVVDTGIHGAHPGPDGADLQTRITSGWAPEGQYQPGSFQVDHGTMVAFDALIAAPGATLLDYALLRPIVNGWGSFLSDALAAYASLLDLLEANPGPMVINNSWALYDRADDEPEGDSANYGKNPDHPFNQMVANLAEAGADVLFAAGNCGAECPDDRCGTGDRGPGASIHGANSHPLVITVAAVTTENDRLGYSSQGPGGLAPRKPDVAAYSHFLGSGVYAADGGTSAASPVAAGLVAALREHSPSIAASTMKGIIQQSATPAPGGWNHDIGYGTINATQALKLIKGGTAAPAAAAATAVARPAAGSGSAWMQSPLADHERENVVKKLRAGRARARGAAAG